MFLASSVYCMAIFISITSLCLVVGPRNEYSKLRYYASAKRWVRASKHKFIYRLKDASKRFVVSNCFNLPR